MGDGEDKVCFDCERECGEPGFKAVMITFELGRKMRVEGMGDDHGQDHALNSTLNI